jgi:hypothetical protein
MKRILAAGAALVGALCAPLALAQPANGDSTPAVTQSQHPILAPANAAPQVGTPLTRLIGPYIAFQNDITALRFVQMNAAADLDNAFNTGIGHDPRALTKGFLAYAAIAAAQDPAFVRSVRDTASFYGRERFIAGLRNDVRYARTLAGADRAVALALAAAAADGARTQAVGEQFRQSAYSLQRARWSNQVAGRPQARIAELRNLSGTVRAAPANFVERVSIQAGRLSGSVAPDGVGGGLFWDALANRADTATLTAFNPGAAAQARPGPLEQHTIDRIVTLAAYHALGVSDSQAEQIGLIADDPTTRGCIEMARLQTLQCVSASRFRYEHSFCLGLHVLRDTGSCMKQIVQPAS